MKNVTMLKTMDPVFWGEAELFGIYDMVHHRGRECCYGFVIFNEMIIFTE
jgi:hypothetical protein